MEVLTHLEPARLRELRAEDSFFWLDLHDPGAAELRELGELLGLHPLAIEDSLEFGQRPKLDPYGDHFLLVYYTVRGRVPVEVHVYVAGDFVLTVRHDECLSLDMLHESIGGSAPDDSEDYLVYQVLDGLTDAFVPAIDEIHETIDSLELEVLQRVNHRQLGTIYRLKQEVQDLQRIVTPQRDAVAEAAQRLEHLPGLEHGSHPYLRDIVDHLAQIGGELGRHSSDLSSLLDTFFNANQNRLNRIVTVLTVVATFFLVWTLVTSFFGQNFRYLTDSVASRTDFYVYGVGGLIVPSIALAAVLWWRRDDWW
jgi:magnesium transporter